MPQQPLTITSGDITLEGALHLPEGAGPFPTVVVCHPHPQYGGDMHNNVVLAVVRGLGERGIAAVRFNFRGVGRSGGAHDGGKGERDDARAALVHTRTLAEIDSARVGLAGYSFGAMMAAAVAEPDIPALALIALPAQAAAGVRGTLAAYPNPLLLTAGDNDHVCPADALREFAASLPGPVETHITAGTDHFWAGYEGELATTVGGIFAGYLTAER